MHDGKTELFGVGRNSSGELFPEAVGTCAVKFTKLNVAPNVVKAISGYTFTVYLTGSTNITL
jgi:hypothetical protein